MFYFSSDTSCFGAVFLFFTSTMKNFLSLSSYSWVTFYSILGLRIGGLFRVSAFYCLSSVFFYSSSSSILFLVSLFEVLGSSSACSSSELFYGVDSGSLRFFLISLSSISWGSCLFTYCITLTLIFLTSWEGALTTLGVCCETFSTERYLNDDLLSLEPYLGSTYLSAEDLLSTEGFLSTDDFLSIDKDLSGILDCCNLATTFY